MDPTTYHVPPKYVFPHQSSAGSGTTSGGGTGSVGAMCNKVTPPLISETVKNLREVKAAEFSPRSNKAGDTEQRSAVARPVSSSRMLSHDSCAGQTTLQRSSTAPHLHSHTAPPAATTSTVLPVDTHTEEGTAHRTSIQRIETESTVSLSPVPGARRDTPSTARATDSPFTELEPSAPTYATVAAAAVTPDPATPSPTLSTPAAKEAEGIAINNSTTTTTPPPPPSDTQQSPSATARMKPRLVSYESAIYKTCFNDGMSTAASSPTMSKINEASNTPVSALKGGLDRYGGMLKASFGGFGSPSSVVKKQLPEQSTSGAVGDATEHNTTSTTAAVANSTSRPVDSEISSYSYGKEEAIAPGEGDSSRLSISNIPEQYDHDDDAATATATYIAESHPEESLSTTTASPVPTPVHTTTATSVQGVRSPPLSGTKHSTSSSARKRSNSTGPRSYLTATALKANDRALTVPSCTCAMCVAFAAGARLQRLPRYNEGQYGAAYARSSRVMSFLSTASTPTVRIYVVVVYYSTL